MRKICRSRTKDQLFDGDGYVTEHPKRMHSGGRPAAQYVIAGAAKLATSLGQHLAA
ncbi:MAG TPA: hypothetical protein VMA54_03495 [Steroidobacteraceae bacterium]|nr:hypothetical protein [Steroidobacteraceae bacterium]